MTEAMSRIYVNALRIAVATDRAYQGYIDKLVDRQMACDCYLSAYKPVLDEGRLLKILDQVRDIVIWDMEK